MVDTLPYGCVTWSLSRNTPPSFETNHALMRAIAFQRRQSPDHISPSRDFQRRQSTDHTTLSYVRQCPQKDTVRERRNDYITANDSSSIVGEVMRQHAAGGAICRSTQSGDIRDDARWGEPGIGKPKNWHIYLPMIVDDLNPLGA